MKYNIPAFILLSCISCSLLAQNPLPRGLSGEEKLVMPHYLPPHYEDMISNPPPYPVRTVAEWEELQAIIVTWTSFTSILTQIVRYAREECMVYIVCSDSNSVKNSLTQSGIPLENIFYIQASYNSIWIRDYGPWTVYREGTGSLNVVDWIYNRPRPYDDLIPGVFAQKIGAPFFSTTTPPYELVHTGGNFLVDGRTTAFSSKLVFQENPGKTESEIDSILKKFMGIERFVTLDVLPYDGIHHIDMHMKLLDEETILMGEYPPGVSDGPQIEANLSYILNNFKTCYGRDFRVIRIPMPPDQSGRYPNQNGDYRTYTNSIIINRTILIPTYEYRYDTTAFRIYREAMPGYKLQGINCNSIIPLNGALHCIVKEIGAYDPIVISHASVRTALDTAAIYPVQAEISASAGISSASVFWTTDTASGFNEIPMTVTDSSEFYAAIPSQPAGSEIFYYLWATSMAGKTIQKPMTAPRGFYRFTVETFTQMHLPSGVPVSGFRLYPNYPNPFNSETKIRFHLPERKEIRLMVFSSTGELVEQLYTGFLGSGDHVFRWNAGDRASGVYFYSVVSDGARLTGKLLLLK